MLKEALRMAIGGEVELTCLNDLIGVVSLLDNSLAGSLSGIMTWASRRGTKQFRRGATRHRSIYVYGSWRRLHKFWWLGEGEEGEVRSRSTRPRGVQEAVS